MDYLEPETTTEISNKNSPLETDRLTPFLCLVELGLSSDYLSSLLKLGVSEVTDLPRLVALAFEHPIGSTLDTDQALASSLIDDFGRQLYHRFLVDDIAIPSTSLAVENETVTYRFSLESQSVNISASATVPTQYVEDYLNGLLRKESVTIASGAIKYRVDPLDDLEFVFDNLEGIEKSNKKRSTREALSVIVERFGLHGTPRKTLEEIGNAQGVTRERIRQKESRGIKRLRDRWAKSHLRRLSGLVQRIATELDSDPEDPLIERTLRRMFPRMRDNAEPWLRVLAALYQTEWIHLKREPLTGMEEAVADVLTMMGPIALDELVIEVAARLELAPNLGLRARVINSRFCAMSEGDIADLAEVDGTDRTILRYRRLNAMRQVLAHDGPMHFADLTSRIRTLLDPDDPMTERNVHAWLDRYDDIFVWIGPGTFRLRRGTDRALERESLPARYAPRRRRGIGDAIVALLLERQPRSLAEIQSHILPRFMVNRGSILASILQDAAGRFVMTDDRNVFLSDADIAAFEADRPKLAGVIDWNEVAADLADFGEDHLNA